MKRLVLAAAAVALLAPGATAATGTCLDLADPAGDVRVSDLLPALPGGTAHEVDSVDLVGVRVEAVTAGELAVTFRVAGVPEPRPGTSYEYRMLFSDADYEYELSADIAGLVRVPTAGSPYELLMRPRTGGQPWTHSVSGTIDVGAGTVSVSTVTLPWLGNMDPGRTFSIDGFAAYAGAPGAAHGPVDTIAGGHTLVVGDGCP